MGGVCRGMSYYFDWCRNGKGRIEVASEVISVFKLKRH
jgi:hypothetical protein